MPNETTTTTVDPGRTFDELATDGQCAAHRRLCDQHIMSKDTDAVVEAVGRVLKRVQDKARVHAEHADVRIANSRSV